MSELIEVVDLYKTYQMGEVSVPVLHGVSLSIKKGEFVALMGVSGSGKSTLMNILGCLDRPSSGHYYLEGKDVSQISLDQLARIRNQKMGFVFQNFNLLRKTSALDNVLLPTQYSAKPVAESELRKRAKEMLSRLGLADRLNHDPSQLSGGQQQRVAIARALINQPSILFADEPTGNLDSHTTDEIIKLFKEVTVAQGITMLLVTHEGSIAKHAQRIVHIQDGIISNGILTQVNKNEN